MDALREAKSPHGAWRGAIESGLKQSAALRECRVGVAGGGESRVDVAKRVNAGSVLWGV